jgi:uncharacterized membrane protein
MTRVNIRSILLSAVSLLLLAPAEALARAGGGSHGFSSPGRGGGYRGVGHGGHFFFFGGGGGGGLFLLILIIVFVMVLNSRARRPRRRL